MRVITDGALACSNGVILAVGPLESIKRRYPYHRLEVFPHAVLLPGLVNAHIHLELPPLLETIRASDFADWVLNLIAAKRRLVRQDYIKASIDNIRTLLQTGTTTVGEISTHGVSREKLRKSGLRAVVFDEIISMGPRMPGVKKRTSNSSASRLVTTGLSPHTPYTVGESVLRNIATSTANSGIRIAMHVAEPGDEMKLLRGKPSRLEKIYTFAQWDSSWAPSGNSSFEYLHRTGILSPRFIAVHAVHTDDRDIALMRKHGVSVVHCPRSNKEVGAGTMKLKQFLKARIAVGLGTDSLASSPSLNMWDEMRFACQLHRRDGITAHDIFRIATIGGAKALGLDHEIGTLDPGKRADIIAVPLPARNTGDIYSDLIRETKSCNMAMVNGKILHHLR